MAVSRRTKIFLWCLAAFAVAGALAVALGFWLLTSVAEGGHERALVSEREHAAEVAKYEIPKTADRAIAKYGPPATDDSFPGLRILTWKVEKIELRYRAAYDGASVLDKVECIHAPNNFPRKTIDCREAAWMLRGKE